ncbi:hypothetical protein AB0I77_06015 [Streptomyces sp. NPDC050619]|uniref:hypothetical protein n=1 Tax=Streptomyces sp. NPDC050619 TaxID=3157214 RepID=UPI00343CE427
MLIRAQSAWGRTPRAWWTPRTAALCPALAVLLAALVMCLGYAAHGGTGGQAAAMTGVSAVQMPAGSAQEHRAEPAAHHHDCPAGDQCCAPAAHGVRTVITPLRLLPAVPPDMPNSAGQPGSPPLCTGPPPTGSAPDLHVLQVQRI